MPNAVRLTSHFVKLNVTIGFLKLRKTCGEMYNAEFRIKDELKELYVNCGQFIQK